MIIKQKQSSKDLKKNIVSLTLHQY